MFWGALGQVVHQGATPYHATTPVAMYELIQKQ
jgi:hypothetical protein